MGNFFTSLDPLVFFFSFFVVLVICGFGFGVGVVDGGRSLKADSR